jgi:hypothetical protein
MDPRNRSITTSFNGNTGYYLDNCFVLSIGCHSASVTVAGAEEFTSSDRRPLLVKFSFIGQERSSMLVGDS